MIFWVNLHPAFLLGLGFLILCLLSELLSATDKSKTRKKNIIYSFALLFSCLAISIINPQGIKIYKYIQVSKLIRFDFIKLLKGFFISQETVNKNVGDLIPRASHQADVIEWVPPRFWLDEPFFWVLMILGVILLFFFFKKNQKGEVPYYLSFCFLATRSMRYISVFVYATIDIIAKNLNQMIDFVGKCTRGKRWKQAGICLSMILIVLMIIRYSNKIGKDLRFGINQGLYPIGAVNFLKDNSVQGNVFNLYEWGGYLSFNLPEKKIFIDGKGVEGGDYFFDAYIYLINGGLEYNEYFEKFNINFLVIRPSFTFGSHIPLIDRLYDDDNWQLIYADENSLIFIKYLDENKYILDKFNVPKKSIYTTLISCSDIILKMSSQLTNAKFAKAYAYIRLDEYKKASDIYYELWKMDRVKRAKDLYEDAIKMIKK
jgi:hypothetical protein